DRTRLSMLTCRRQTPALVHQGLDRRRVAKAHDLHWAVFARGSQRGHNPKRDVDVLTHACGDPRVLGADPRRPPVRGAGGAGARGSASNLLSMFTTTTPPCCAFLHTGIRAFESAGATTMASTR